MLKTIFAQDTAEAAREQWASVTDALRERCPKLTELMDRSREIMSRRARGNCQPD
jgi:transposase-like protein